MPAKPKITPDEYIAALEHPLKPAMLAIRDIIRKADKRLAEGFKWNSPSYAIEGHDRITFNVVAPDKVRLVFHLGTKVKEDKKQPPFFEDDSGLLEWISDIRAIASFSSLEEVQQNKAKLTKLVKRWLQEAEVRVAAG